MSKRPLVLVLLVGCGGGEDPPPLGEVTIAVTRHEDPIAGATVVFHDAGGEVLSSGLTDAAGRITGEVTLPTGMVTVVDPADPVSLLTLAAVGPGPAVIDIPLTPGTSLSDEPVAIGSVFIDAPPGGLPAGTHHIMVDSGCGTLEVASLPMAVLINERCVSDAGTVPVIATAWTENLNLENPGVPLAYVAGVATAAPGSTEWSLAPGAWSTTCATVDVTTDPVMSVALWPRLEGLNFHRSIPGYCPWQLPAVPVLDFGEGLTMSSFSYVGGGDLRQTFMVTSYAALPAAIDIDMAADLLTGDVELLAMDGQGAAWSRDPALDGARAINAELIWGLPDQRYVRWSFLLPGDATALSRPALPADVQTWPALGGATERIAEVRYLDTPWLPSLDALQHALPDVLDPAPRITRQPPGMSFRSFRERFYPDAGN